MTPTDPPGRFAWCKEPLCTRGVFGLFLVIVAAGFGWSVTHAPSGLDALTGPARANQVALAYAACQAHIRQTTPSFAHLRLGFPAEPESAEADGADALSLSSSLIATPRLGAPYTQHFTCRAERAKGARSAAWRVGRLAMDLPVS